MRKLFASLKKEYLLLSRDIGGLLILFLMPVLLVITITLIQETTFKSVRGANVEVLIVDRDHGKISEEIKKNLQEIPFLQPISTLEEKAITEKQASQLVAKGTYQLAVVIPEGLSEELNVLIDRNVEKIISGFSGGTEENSYSKEQKAPPKTIRLYFDPATQQTFRSSVQFSVEKMISKLEAQFIYKAFEQELGNSDGLQAMRTQNFVRFEKINPSLSGGEILPNSVQHNIPAWTLFAIFFLILPLSLNLVKEKHQGTFIRLQTSPVNYLTLVSGKAILYLLVCLLQFLLILGIGIFLFPQIGLPELQLQGNLFLLLIVTVFSGLAAIGLGVLLGTLFSTQEQAAPFGAILVILLAAIGGVWVPVFAMPGMMRHLATLSPMNWGLEAYYVLFLRNGSLVEIAPYLLALFLFFVVTAGIALLVYEKKKKV
ncbi:MAG TPA: ABC transporter permease [Flavobacteriaceae bacterium]|nr:ABC transporter permease [Flavobacteriaceae bacterium]